MSHAKMNLDCPLSPSEIKNGFFSFGQEESDIKVLLTVKTVKKIIRSILNYSHILIRGLIKGLKTN